MKSNRPKRESSQVPTAEARKSAKKRAPEIGPVRRSRDEVESRRLAAQLEQEAAAEPREEAPIRRAGRNPATPEFGRFVEGPVAKRPLRELTSEILSELVTELRANGRSLLHRIDSTFSRQDQRPLGVEDLGALLRQHNLMGLFLQTEKENLRTLLRQNRGFEPPVRRVLGLSPSELRQRIRLHKLGNEVNELLERAREEARADAPLLNRLQLATSRTELLRDIGALAELDARNLPELEEALEASMESVEASVETGAVDPVVLVELARRSLAVDPPLWRKVTEHYRLVHAAARLLGVPPPAEPFREPRAGGERPGRRGARPAGDRPERSGGGRGAAPLGTSRAPRSGPPSRGGAPGRSGPAGPRRPSSGRKPQR